MEMKGYKKERTLIKGSAFKTFVDSLPKVKNSTNLRFFSGFAKHFLLHQPLPSPFQYANIETDYFFIISILPLRSNNVYIKYIIL